MDSPVVVVEMLCNAFKLNASHGKAHMLRAGKALRFTPDEVATYRSLGIDFDGARTQDDIDQALTAWAGTLADERPALLDSIVSEMAKVKGVKPPVRLERVLVPANTAVPSTGSLRRS